MPTTSVETSAAKVDIIVHGRFHAFALARALIELGHDVLVHTNYPAAIVARFGVPRENVRSFLTHGVAARALAPIDKLVPNDVVQPRMHRLFGAWSARSVRKDADLVYGFSGVSEEYLRTPRTHLRQCRMVVRGSCHIRAQARLLAEEEARTGFAIERPRQWIVEREEREYELADRIAVLSRFAYDSFVELKPEFADKLFINALGVNTGHFRATPLDIAARRSRILSGAPLKVLTVGTFSFRKGMLDLVEVARQMGQRAKFRFVGDFPAETAELRKAADGLLELSNRVSEAELPAVYREADMFLFPTIEDGFAAVLLQAAVGGLPIVATTNCSAPDFLVQGETGWIVPIRDPAAMARQINWCDMNRQELADIAERACNRSISNDWNRMASGVIIAYRSILGEIGVQ